ncbi:MAG: FHA domain-containing protein [Byssovorax sp.]
MGFFDRFVSKSKSEGRRAKEARAKELAGDLAAAVDLYEEAGLLDEAARVMLLRADAEPSAEKRIALFSLAAFSAQSEELKKKARGRKALVAFDVLRARGGSFMKSEVLSVARELEEAGELEPAADAYALAGDAESEVRALTAAGAIEKLEDRLRVSERAARTERDREITLRKLSDLDRTAERRAALELAVNALAAHEDERIADAARAIRARLARGPVVDLEIDGALGRYALGAEVTLGRGDATIVLGSRAVSRRHLRLRRRGADAIVEDLDTRNGTTLAGARLSGPVSVGAGITLELGGEVPVQIAPAAGCLFSIQVAGLTYLCPLGPLPLDAWSVDHETARDESYVVLKSEGGAGAPLLGDYQLSPRVELCAGDEIRAARGGAVRLRVPVVHHGSASHEETGIHRKVEL